MTILRWGTVTMTETEMETGGRKRWVMVTWTRMAETMTPGSSRTSAE
jgi:hypothetical protein